MAWNSAQFIKVDVRRGDTVYRFDDTNPNYLEIQTTLQPFSFKRNQQDATLCNILYYSQCCTFFRRFLRPSSGAQKLYTRHRVYSPTPTHFSCLTTGCKQSLCAHRCHKIAIGLYLQSNKVLHLRIPYATAAVPTRSLTATSFSTSTSPPPPIQLSLKHCSIVIIICLQ